MLYREIIAVCSQIHTKHINTLCGQNVELLNVKLAVRVVTSGLRETQTFCRTHTHTHARTRRHPHRSIIYKLQLKPRLADPILTPNK